MTENRRQPVNAEGRTAYFLVYILPVLAYCLLIFWLSAQSDLDVYSPFAVPDKLAHLLEYAGLGFLLMRWLTAPLAVDAFVSRLPLVFVLATLYGLSDELHQLTVPGREFSWMDLVADGAGAYLGARLYMIFWRYKVEKK